MHAKQSGQGKFGTTVMGLVSAVALGAAVSVVGGCMSYANVPGPESAPAFTSANHFQSVEVMAAALDRVLFKFPPAGAGGQYAINLPVGTNPESAAKVIEMLPAGAIVPFEGMSDDIPVYHICRVWIRASEAKIDVIYPATLYDGTAQDQNVTIWLRGGLTSWRFYRQQYWSAGTFVKPAIYIPVEQIDEQNSVIQDSVDLNEEAYDQLDEDSVDDSASGMSDVHNEQQDLPEQVEESSASTQEPSGSLYKQVPIDD